MDDAITPDSVLRPDKPVVSTLITEIVAEQRSLGAVDWRCGKCKSTGIIPFGTVAVNIRLAHQELADKTGDKTDYMHPPWQPCGVEFESCPNCSEAARINFPTALIN